MGAINKPAKRKMRCDKHGLVRWKGHVICGGCGRVYQTVDPGAPFYAPETCECAARLMPKDNAEANDASVDFQVCALCPTCYGRVRRDFDGILPPAASGPARA